MLDSRDQEAPAPFLRLSAVRKSYPGVLALSGFDLEVASGEVIGLVGENGAGKSTLMKILGGVTAPDSGSIEVDGVPYAALSVGGSMKAGIAFVHQELNLFDNLDVAANVYIGREPRRAGVLNLVDEKRSAPTCCRISSGSAPIFLPTPRWRSCRWRSSRWSRSQRHCRSGCAARHPRRADLYAADGRDRQAAGGDRRLEGRRHRGDLRLAPAARDRARL